MNNSRKANETKSIQVFGFFTYSLLQCWWFIILFKFYVSNLMSIFLYTVNFVSISYHIVNPLYQFHPPHLPLPLITNSVLCMYMFDFLWLLCLFTVCVCVFCCCSILHEWNNMVFVFSIRFISLSVMHSGYIHLAANGKISSFFKKNLLSYNWFKILISFKETA